MVEDKGKNLMVIGTIRDLKVCGNGRCQKMQEDTKFVGMKDSVP